MPEETNDQLQKFDNLMHKASRRLLTIRSVFPFDLFPDTIHIDENKIQVVHHTFFWQENVFPVLVKNINAVVVTRNLFFASLYMEVSGYERNPDPVNMLWYKDAILAKRIITGLSICAKEGKDGIDTSVIGILELRSKLEEIGRTREGRLALA